MRKGWKAREKGPEGKRERAGRQEGRDERTEIMTGRRVEGCGLMQARKTRGINREDRQLPIMI